MMQRGGEHARPRDGWRSWALLLAISGLGVSLPAQQVSALKLHGFELYGPPSALTFDDDAEPVLVGCEAEGNDFRSLTPALTRVDNRPIMVDGDELRARKLALYAGSAVPSTRLNGVSHQPEAAAHAQKAPTVAEETPAPAGPSAPLLFLCGGLLAGGWLVWRGLGRPSLGD
ncbi:MAG: hypothetical protein AAF628_27205 [Planctomycetota bacterium]